MLRGVVFVLLEVRDPTFQKRSFKQALDILELYYMTCRLSDIDIDMAIVSDGQNSYGYRHKIIVWDDVSKKSFSVVLYENQSLRRKGEFRINLSDKENNFNARQAAVKLKQIGIDQWKYKPVGIYKQYVIWLPNQEVIKDLIILFQGFIP